MPPPTPPRKSLAARRAPAGIARGGDLPVIDWEHGRVVPASDFRGGVGGGIVHHDDFIRLAHDAGGVMDRLQRAAKARLFIVRWNDE